MRFSACPAAFSATCRCCCGMEPANRTGARQSEADSRPTHAGGTLGSAASHHGFLDFSTHISNPTCSSRQRRRQLRRWTGEPGFFFASGLVPPAHRATTPSQNHHHLATALAAPAVLGARPPGHPSPHGSQPPQTPAALGAQQRLEGAGSPAPQRVFQRWHEVQAQAGDPARQVDATCISVSGTARFCLANTMLAVVHQHSSGSLCPLCIGWGGGGRTGTLASWRRASLGCFNQCPVMHELSLSGLPPSNHCIYFERVDQSPLAGGLQPPLLPRQAAHMLLYNQGGQTSATAYIRLRGMIYQALGHFLLDFITCCPPLPGQ
jgi:hypothetical protein